LRQYDAAVRVKLARGVYVAWVRIIILKGRYRMLKAIGYWIGYLEDRKRPAPQELVGVMRAEQRVRLADYLAAGMPHEMYLGTSWCRFGCGIDNAKMGNRAFSDDTWVWPEGLAHYVRDHGVVLPDEFVQHALSKSNPGTSGWQDDPNWYFSRLAMNLKVDHSFWEEWCASRRSKRFLEQLQTTQEEVEALVAADEVTGRFERITAPTGERGEGDARCLWMGCPNNALPGGYICARHSLGDPDSDPKQRRGPALEAVLGDLSRAQGLKPLFMIPKGAAITRLGPRAEEGY
jgi:hypothetical protein